MLTSRGLMGQVGQLDKDFLYARIRVFFSAPKVSANRSINRSSAALPDADLYSVNAFHLNLHVLP